GRRRAWTALCRVSSICNAARDEYPRLAWRMGARSEIPRTDFTLSGAACRALRDGGTSPLAGRRHRGRPGTDQSVRLGAPDVELEWRRRTVGLARTACGRVRCVQDSYLAHRTSVRREFVDGTGGGRDDR